MLRAAPLAFRGVRCFSYTTFRSVTKSADFVPAPTSGDTNIISESNRLEKTLTKFWDKVNVHGENGKYDIRLDNKPLKTPLGNRLAVDEAKKRLAYLISHEWESMLDVKIKPSSLPLTSMAARAIDLEAVHEAEEVDQELVAKIGDLTDIKYNLLQYLDTDTCLIFTTLSEYEGRLRARQEELYVPLKEEFEDYFTEYARKNGLLPSPDYRVHLETLDCETDGLLGKSQNLTTQNIVLHWLDQLLIADLVAFEKAVLSSKSFLCGVSILRSNAKDNKKVAEFYQVNKAKEEDYFNKSLDEIIELGNLETIFQTNEWGEVEDTHDVDKVDWIRNLSAAALMCR